MLKQEQKEELFNEFEKIRKSRGLTYADIEDVFSQNDIDYTGDCGLMHPNFENVVMWAGFNEEMVSLINDYIQKYHLVYYPTSTLMYVTSGRVLNYPQVKDFSRLDSYKTVHWLPVELVTRDEASNRLAQEKAEYEKNKKNR